MADETREAIKRVLTSHAAIDLHPWTECLCGKAQMTVTEYADHLAGAVLSSGLVVPVGEVVNRLAAIDEVAQTEAGKQAETTTEALRMVVEVRDLAALERDDASAWAMLDNAVDAAAAMAADAMDTSALDTTPRA